MGAERISLCAGDRRTMTWSLNRARKDIETWKRESEAVAAHNRKLLDRSGLPECAEANKILGALHRLPSKRDEHDLTVMMAEAHQLEAHAANCATCLARRDFVAHHGAKQPPMPVLPGARLFHSADRALRFLGVPEGEAGKGRREGLFVAVALTFIGAIQVATRAIAGRWKLPTLYDVLGVAGILAAYFVAFFLAGAVFDATRRMEQRFIGYVVRGAAGAAAVWLALGTAMALSTPQFRGPILLFLIPGAGAIGGTAGAALWISDRLRGRIGHRRP